MIDTNKNNPSSKDKLSDKTNEKSEISLRKEEEKDNDISTKPLEGEELKKAIEEAKKDEERSNIVGSVLFVLFIPFTGILLIAAVIDEIERLFKRKKDE
ncbi:MAG: hypothetical protein ACP5T6_02685 [Candidatus Micrarchaeia archaeon]